MARRDLDVTVNYSKKTYLPFGDVIFNKMLVNKDGLVANNVADKEGRDNYFPGAGGATESVLLLAKGVADAYIATGEQKWLDYLEHLLQGVNKLYDDGNNQVAHWLFSVKNAFIGENPHYDRLFTFTAGKATIPESLGGGITKNIFHVRSNPSEYLWINPYSSLTSGTFKPILTTNKLANKTTEVQLVDTSFNGTAYIMYTTLEGARVDKSAYFEAWPYWRTLDSGEVNVAMDSVAWSLDMYSSIRDATEDTATYQPIINNISAHVLDHYNVNDGRAWITKRLVNPLQVAGSFKFTETTGLILDYAPDGAIIFKNTTVPPPGGFNSEYQFGRAVSDSILPADYILIDITLT